MTDRAPPLDWPRLLADAGTLEWQSAALDALEADAGASIDAPHLLMGQGCECVMAIAVLLGPGVTAPALAALASRGGASAVRDMIAGARSADAPLILDVLTAANACGASSPRGFAASDAQAARLLDIAAPELGRLSEAARLRAALAAVAHGLLDRAPPGASGFVPGARFGPDLQALVRYLARAVEVGAPGDAVDPALRDALLAFPGALRERAIDWGDLGWLGRIRFHRLGGVPLSEVAERMFELVRSL